MKTTTRKFDAFYEAEVSKFMDRYFYAKLPLSAKRITDKALQIKGVDVQLRKDKFSRKCVSLDEKAKLYSTLNKILQYPSFELSFVNRSSERQCGWFLNPTSLTNFYVFINIFGKNLNTMNDIKEKNIDSATLLFVSKNDVLALLEKRGVELENEVEKLADKKQTYPNEKMRVLLSDEFWLTRSCQLQEQPINLVFRRQVLELLPNSKQFSVTREKITEIKA